jgi:DNA-binding FrmR family transcriptional regulator
MWTVTTLSPAAYDKLIKRLQRIEGQARGVRRMIEEDRDCQDILVQLAAIRGAAHQISVMVIREYAMTCLSDPEQHGSPDEAVAKLVQVLVQIPY